MSLNDVERAEAEVRDDGGRYIVYEHLSQGSPTLLENERKEVRPRCLPAHTRTHTRTHMHTRTEHTHTHTHMHVHTRVTQMQNSTRATGGGAPARTCFFLCVCVCVQTYRHALAVTAMRPDSQGMPYLYTLNMSCRQAMWDDLQPLFTVRA